MNIAAGALWIGLLAMIAALAYGFTAGGGWVEVGQLMRYPWFIVSLVDVYVGFGLFGGWIIHRERASAAAVWILLLLTLGNVISCAYVLMVLRRSDGDWSRFWHGHRSPGGAVVS